MQHCVDKYGVADVGQWYWEIWNEPDYPGSGRRNASEAPAEMTDYYTLYDNAVDAITAVMPNALVGGPATTQPGRSQAFLQHCKSAGTRVTFVSSHNYPGRRRGRPPAERQRPGQRQQHPRQPASPSGGYTTTQVKSFNTEWNSSYSGQGGGTGDVRHEHGQPLERRLHPQGGQAARRQELRRYAAVDMFSYWVLSDVFDESSGPSGSYILGQERRDAAVRPGVRPDDRQGMRKAAFNAFKMLNYLGPKRLMSGGGTGGDGVDAMATMSATATRFRSSSTTTTAALDTTGTDR